MRSINFRTQFIKLPLAMQLSNLIKQSLNLISFKTINVEYIYIATTVNANTRTGTIGSVETKIGALRITAYNPFKESTDYFYVSKRDMKYVKSPCYGVNDHKERILFFYSKKVDAYGMFEDYRVKNFEDLARS